MKIENLGQPTEPSVQMMKKKEKMFAAILQLTPTLTEEQKATKEALDCKILKETVGKLIHCEYLKDKPQHSELKSALSCTDTEFERKFLDMPLTTYGDYKEFTEKIYFNNGLDIMSKGKPIMVAKSGGSTGEPKYLPIYQTQFTSKYKQFPTPEFVKAVQALTSSPSFDIESRGVDLFNKKINDFCPPNCSESKNHIPVGYVSTTAPVCDNDFEPLMVKKIGNHNDRLLIGLLFSLSNKDCAFFRTIFLNVIADMFVLLEQKFDILIESIEKGVLIEDCDLNVHLEPSIRENLADQFEANPERAAELRTLIGNEKTHESFHKIINQIWPFLHVIVAAYSGPFLKYKKTVEYYLNTSTTALIDSAYGSSEMGVIGIPTCLLPNHYIINGDVYLEYQEFNTSNLPVRCTELEVGKQYEAIVTNLNGWLRYKSDDILEFRGFIQGNPVVSVIMRTDGQFKIDPAIITQNTILESVSLASLVAPVRDFVCFEDLSSRPSAYAFFFELLPQHYDFESDDENIVRNIYYEKSNQDFGPKYQLKLDHSVISQMEETIEFKFREDSFLYTNSRDTDKILKVKVYFVPPATFHYYREFKAKLIKAPILTQIKVPVFTTDLELVDTFLDAVKLVKQ